MRKKQKKRNKMKQKLEKYFIYFMLYSMIGWCYEVFLEVVVYRWGFSNRGFLFGPYCPVYGFGALTFIIFLRKLKATPIKLWKINITPIFVFVGIMLIATTIELVTSYILEISIGGWLWDYSAYSFNFQGRIALNPSVRFGLGGMIFLYVFQPLFEKFCDNIGKMGVKIVSTAMFVVFAMDFLVKVVYYII